MDLTLEQKERQQQWQERTKHYPYNVLTGIYSVGIDVSFNKTFDYTRFEQNLADYIEERLSELPPALQYVFMLYVEGEQSYDQIARQEELPKEVVLDRISLTWRHLRHPKRSREWQTFWDTLRKAGNNADVTN